MNSSTGSLYIVPTPIGHLSDMTFRAVEVLKQVALIACEDTRVSGKLLSHYDIDTPTLSYNDHNAGRQRPALIEKLLSGDSIALISDAGTPLVSDPGYKLVLEAIEQSIPVIPLPGASSVLTALCASGLPSDQFFFAGFLPHKEKARKDMIASLKAVPSSLIFLDSPKRLTASLQILHDLLGDRDAVIAREMTKLHEEFRRGPLRELAAHYNEQGAPKGEVVIVVGPEVLSVPSQEIIDKALQEALVLHSVKDAAALVSKQLSVSKSELYERALSLKHDGTD